MVARHIPKGIGKHLKVIVWDIETRPMKLWAWSLWQKFFSIDNIIEDVEIIVVCWKELGKKKIHTLTQRKDNEYELIRKLRDVFDKADVLIGHNADAFDLRHFTAKLIEYDLPPLSKIQTIDTLKEGKRVAKFTSNKLDYAAKKYIKDAKRETDFQLWVDCANGVQKAFREMESYCRHDIEVTEDWYVRLRPYMIKHPNLAEDGTGNCPFCNSSVSKFNKKYRTKAGITKAHHRCLDCGAPFTFRKIGPRAAETRPYSVV